MNENPDINDVSRSGAAGLSGFVLGAIVGAGVALLLAPATGTDTRRRLGETAKKLGSAARDKIQEGKEQIRDRFENGRQNLESGRQAFETAGQTGSRTTPGKTPQGSSYTP